MPKAKKETKTRTSAKQVLAAYKNAALTYIQQLRNPVMQPFFSVKGYLVTNNVKKPNAISVPELLAIIGTATRLGQEIRLTSSGVDDGGQVNVNFVASVPRVPDELFSN